MTSKLDVKGLGLALGILWALGAFFLGLAAWLFGWAVPAVDVLSSLYIGYGPSLLGSIIGAIYGFIDGFIGGVIVAWLYNKFAGMKK